MATAKKHRKFRPNMLGISLSLFLFSLLAYVCSAIFLHSYINTLSAAKQSVDADISTLRAQNDALRVDIQTLSTPERINAIAASDGMTLNQENIVTIAEESTDGE